MEIFLYIIAYFVIGLTISKIALYITVEYIFSYKSYEDQQEEVILIGIFWIIMVPSIIFYSIFVSIIKVVIYLFKKIVK